MIAVQPKHLRRLSASLAMLDAPTDGEKLAAIAAAKRLLDRIGIGFAELAGGITVLPPPPEPGPDHDFVGHLEALRMLTSGFPWNAWERKFLHSVRSQRTPLSECQAAKLSHLRQDQDAWRARRRAS